LIRLQLPIAYASRAFTKGESNKCTNHFTIKTDPRPLIYLFSMINPSSKLTRMRIEFKHGRKITAKYDVSDLNANGILD